MTDAWPVIPSGPIEKETLLRDTLRTAGVDLGTFAVITSWVQRASEETP